VKYCCKCIQPNTRPGIVFDEEGICSACRISEQRKFIDWEAREQELRRIVRWAKSNSKGGFDCVVGVSGGKDSHFQAFYARDQLGLKTLLVNSVPENITEVGRKNLNNLAEHGFDLISYRPNPKVMKSLTHKGFFEHGNPCKPSEYSLYASSWIVAVGFNVPMVIQGENPVHTLGIVKDMSDGGNAYNIREHNTVSGDNSQWVGNGVELKDLLPYQFPSLEEVGSIKSVWLSHYIKEWSFTGNTEFAISKGLQGRPNHDPHKTGKLNRFCSVDSDIHLLNQLLKYYKFGFGFVTDEVCYDIREGRLTREEGIRLVKQHDGRLDEKHIKDFCSYIEITVERFWDVVDGFINKDLFHKEGLWRVGGWTPKFVVGGDYVPREENRGNSSG